MNYSMIGEIYFKYCLELKKLNEELKKYFSKNKNLEEYDLEKRNFIEKLNCLNNEKEEIKNNYILKFPLQTREKISKTFQFYEQSLMLFRKFKDKKIFLDYVFETKLKNIKSENFLVGFDC